MSRFNAVIPGPNSGQLDAAAVVVKFIMLRDYYCLALSNLRLFTQQPLNHR